MHATLKFERLKPVAFGLLAVLQSSPSSVGDLLKLISPCPDCPAATSGTIRIRPSMRRATRSLSKTMNKIITATHQGEDGQKHTYALIYARDWTGVTLQGSPELPPICPVACQNLPGFLH